MDVSAPPTGNGQIEEPTEGEGKATDTSTSTPNGEAMVQFGGNFGPNRL